MTRLYKPQSRKNLCGLPFPCRLGSGRWIINKTHSTSLKYGLGRKLARHLSKKIIMREALCGTCKPWISLGCLRHLEGIGAPRAEQLPVRCRCRWTLWSWAVQSHWFLGYPAVRSPCITPRADFCSFLRGQAAHSTS